MSNARDRFDQAKSLINMCREAADSYEHAKGWYDRRRTWTVELQEDDRSYRQVQDWLLSEIPPKDHKNLRAISERQSTDDDPDEMDLDDWETSSVSSRYQTVMRLSFTDSLHERIYIDGHLVDVSIGSKPRMRRSGNKVEDALNNLMDDYDGNSSNSSVSFGPQKMTFRARSVAGHKAIINKLDSIIRTSVEADPRLYIANSWGHWGSSEIPARSMDSVILKPGLADDLIGDLKKFLASEKRYVEAGIPWRRGYLLYGPPGTGKSSIIRGLSTELGLDLWYVPFGDVKAEDKLHQLVNNVNKGILLLEDVDEFTAAQARDGESGDAKKSVTTSSLLNILDGVTTPHGLIVVMTTNHKSKLDDALLRAGRVDRKVKIGLPDWDIVSRLWDQFFPEKAGVLASIRGIDVQGARPGFSQADACELFKRNWDDPEIALTELSAIFGFEAHK